jgi:signal transduction histidine kinase/CheY-like chemotaxis protein
MWHTLRLSRGANPDLVSSAHQLLESTSRTLIIAVTGVCMVWLLMATILLPDDMIMQVTPLTLLVMLNCALGLWLLPRRRPTGQAVWQVGLAGAITLAIYVFRQPMLGFFYALLPLVAAVTIGWPASVLAVCLVAGLVWWLTHAPWAWSQTTPVGLGMIIVAGGILSGLLGWAATEALLTVAQWALDGYEQARKRIEEARDQRLAFKQAQEDLVLANRELTRLSERLEIMHQVAEEARRAKEEFVANVSHELRTPLNIIIGFSEMILQSPQLYGERLPPTLLADIATIQRNSQHLTRLVDDVLDLSQVDSGRMALTREWISLQSIVSVAVSVVRSLFESKGLYLETDVPPDLPPILCDSTRIRQVVINLLSNAGRFAERGGVRVCTRRQRDQIVVSVADTGPGIPERDQQRIFEPFQQLDGSIRRRHGGSGLGLSISKRFVEMHGGKMWLESKVDVGTTIHFSLPLETPPPPVLADDVKRWFSPYHEYGDRDRRSLAPTQAVPPRLVILERGDVLQRLFERYADDIEIVAVRDAEEAVRELGRSPAQALVVNAPSVDEESAPMNWLTHLPYNTPAITCWVPGKDEAARRLGVVRYLVKPITRESLLSALEELGEEVRTVLLVDDEPEVLQLFSRILTSAERGYRVLRAKSGRRALDLLRERRPDLVLLDLIMPGVDGFQVLQQKSQDLSIQDIPVVVISSRDPAREPIVSSVVTVTRSSGLSASDLLTCVRSISETLTPSA